MAQRKLIYFLRRFTHKIQGIYLLCVNIYTHMSDYKNYQLRQLGIKESSIKPSTVDRNSFPGIDPRELEMGTEDEKDEHGMPIDKAKLTAKQHLAAPGQAHYYSGVEKARTSGMLKDTLMGGLSPTAIATPVIGIAVRGSSTGGLPSGMDQTGISSSTPTGRLGGYEPIPSAKDNSEVVDGTPSNPQINSANPISDVSTTDAHAHNHQIQQGEGEPPQNITGASTESDATLVVKDPPQQQQKTVDIDVNQEGEEPNDMDGQESMEDEDKAKAGLNEGKHKAGCKCGFCANKGSFKKKVKEESASEDEDNQKDNPDFKEKDEKQFRKDRADSDAGKEVQKHFGKDKKKDKVDEKYSPAFERMRGLANLGSKRLSSNGLWENVSEVNYTKNAAGKDVIAVGAPGSKVRNAIEKGEDDLEYHGDNGDPNLDNQYSPKKKTYKSDGSPDVYHGDNGGPANECGGCGCGDPNHDHKHGLEEKGNKWMQDVGKGAEKNHTKGALRKDLGVSKDKTIPTERLESIKRTLSTKAEKGPLTDKELTLSRRVNAALNMRKSNESLNETFKKHKQLMNESIKGI